MFSMAKVMQIVLGWDLNFSIWVSSLTVAGYVFFGGLLSAIFNEVLQFFLIWLGALVVTILGLYETGGWSGVVHRIHERWPGGDYTHMWSGLGSFTDNPMGIHWTGIVMGLGFVISFGYWTTDFLVVQRVLAAKDLRSAKMAPIIGAAFKMAVPLIVILPGLLGSRCCRTSWWRNRRRRPIPPRTLITMCCRLMLARYCGPGLLGLGITALIAGFMSGMAGNVSAFATVWTYDIYRAVIKKDADDDHYVTMGKWCTVLGVLVSIGTAYLVMQFNSIMDYVQALFSFFIAPLFGTVILGMLWKRATPAGGFWGLLAGTRQFDCDVGVGLEQSFGISVHCAFAHKRKPMAENMYRALWSWIVCVGVTVVVSLMTTPKPDEELVGLVYGATEIPSEGDLLWFQKPIFWAALVAIALVIVNIIFW